MSEPQVVIVTGGGKGIGFGICRTFAWKKAKVVIADVNEALARESAAQLVTRDAATDAIGVACDVTDRASVSAMVKTVLAKFGRVDVLVNNAGICPFQHIMEMDDATFRKTIDVDLIAPFICTQEVARHMIERGGGGSIIHITSLAEEETSPTQVDYAAAKSGLRMLMAGFATALGPHGINSNAVAPGHVKTDLTRFYWDTEAAQKRIPHMIPTGRLAQPEDIGHACVYLASPEASYVNGITLRVDGGNSVLNR